MAEAQGLIILAQDQYAFLQDATKGTVSVYAGPYSFSLSANDRPVVYDPKRGFISASVTESIRQNVMVPEGHYLMMENPAFDNAGKLQRPSPGNNSPTSLISGRRIVIPGPITLPLWPGQSAEAIPGHHLRSNQYLVVRVYNAEEAGKNASDLLKGDNGTFTPGQLLVIKGTEASFFIPPTGFEVLKDDTGQFVREALTLERLEYCNLLDEDGNKRIEQGPAVVFPEATERFNTDKNGNRKFKAIELNDQMGLYIKVIADYDDMKTGEELFITGKEQRIYYPRSEHALIEYDDPTKGFKRQRYYGITIPKGEGRYVLDKSAGIIKKVTGPCIFLPDPRNEVIVRRVLDDKTVNLLYPGNVEALNYNKSLRSLTEDSTTYLADSVVLSAAADITRGINRGTQKSNALLGGSYEGSTMSRGSSFTPPPMLTLSTKYDGIPSINVYTGYAVQVVNKSGERRIEVGPTTILLEYDESLEVIELSTGKPKSTDPLMRDVYLRVDNNLISDIVRIETKDLVGVDLKLSYRVNFLREHKDNWFSVENYVKYLCDHMRSRLKASMKKQGVKEVIEDGSTLVRDVVLGKKSDETRHFFFAENGMDVYDVEVLGISISDSRIADLLKNVQTRAVENAITMAGEEQNLINTRRKSEIQTEIAELETETNLKRQELAQKIAKAQAEASIKELEAEMAENSARLAAQLAEQDQRSQVSAAQLARVQATSDYEMTLEKTRVELFEKKMAAISPNLIQALQTLGDTEMLTRLSTALAPLALAEQTSIGGAMERVFRGTPMEKVLTNLQGKGRATAAGSEKK